MLVLMVSLCGCAGRADPECTLGQLLKMLFTNDDFTNAVSATYSSIFKPLVALEEAISTCPTQNWTHWNC